MGNKEPVFGGWHLCNYCQKPIENNLSVCPFCHRNQVHTDKIGNEEWLLTDEEIMAGANKYGVAEGGTLVKLSEAGRKEYLGVCEAQIQKLKEAGFEKRSATIKEVAEWLDENTKDVKSYYPTWLLEGLNLMKRGFSPKQSKLESFDHHK